MLVYKDRSDTHINRISRRKRRKGTQLVGNMTNSGFMCIRMGRTLTHKGISSIVMASMNTVATTTTKTTTIHHHSKSTILIRMRQLGHPDTRTTNWWMSSGCQETKDNVLTTHNNGINNNTQVEVGISEACLTIVCAINISHTVAMVVRVRMEEAAAMKSEDLMSHKI